MVHRREIDGQAIVLGNHGALWGNAMTWWDHDTGSVWSQPIGEAILGPRKGERLELLPSTLTTWSDWKAEHPDTYALAAASSPRGFALDQMSIVVEFGEESASVPVADLREIGVLNLVLGGVPIAVVVQSATDNWAVFARELGDRTVELDVDGTELVEVGGAGRWNMLRGLPLGDTTEGLSVLPGFTSFQHDYWTFFPDGLMWDGTELIPEP